MDVTTRKRQLRAQVRATRRARVAAGQTCGDQLLSVARGCRELAALAGGSTAGAYAPLPGEPDVGPLRRWLAGRGVRVLLPTVIQLPGASGAAEPGLAWAPDDGILVPGAPTASGARIDEPPGPATTDPGRLDIVLLPALAVDRDGWRLGQGGGYFDRTIERLGWGATAGDGEGVGPLLVVVVHDDEVLDTVPHEPHERPVHAVLTPTRWLTCRPDRTGPA